MCRNSTPLEVGVPSCPKTRVLRDAAFRAFSFRGLQIHHSFQTGPEMPGGWRTLDMKRASMRSG